MKRLELGRVRVCSRCGRGGAELRGADGERLVVRLDPVHARELSDTAPADDVRSLTDVIVAQLPAAGVNVSEIVLDVHDGGLRALVSLVRGDEVEIVSCPAGEGVALAVRGGIRLYATDEALANAATRAAKPERHGGTGGPDTVH